jgi:hypothetical protein
MSVAPPVRVARTIRGDRRGPNGEIMLLIAKNVHAAVLTPL